MRDERRSLFKWKGPLDVRKVFERFLAALSAGVIMFALLIAYTECIG